MTNSTDSTPTIDSTTEGQAREASSGSQPAEVLYCANHPEVETLLRCNRCGKPICLKCAQLTDVGYRCKECIRGVQDNYFNASPADNLIAFVVALIVSAIATPIAAFLFGIFPFWFFSLLIAFMVGGAAGGILAQIIRRAISRRRSRQLRYFALGGIVFGVLFGGLAAALFLGFSPFNLPLLIFAFLAASTTYQILR